MAHLLNDHEVSANAALRTALAVVDWEQHIFRAMYDDNRTGLTTWHAKEGAELVAVLEPRSGEHLGEPPGAQRGTRIRRRSMADARWRF